jgi:hypothetical protein
VLVVVVVEVMLMGLVVQVHQDKDWAEAMAHLTPKLEMLEEAGAGKTMREQKHQPPIAGALVVMVWPLLLLDHL